MERRSLFNYDFVSQVLILFSIDVLCLMAIGSIFGDDAKNVSTLFQFGSHGLAVSTLMQFLFCAVIIIVLKEIFSSDRIFKNMMSLWRTIFMLFSVLIVIIGFIIVFDWFKLNNYYAWIGFAICFGGGFIISTLVMIIKTRWESKKYDKLLFNYKMENLEEDDE